MAAVDRSDGNIGRPSGSGSGRRGVHADDGRADARHRPTSGRAARRAVEAVIAAVAASLEEPDRDRLAAVLPGSLRGAAEVRGEALHPDSGAALVSAVSAGSGCPAERSRCYLQAVLSTLAGLAPEVARVLARRPSG